MKRILTFALACTIVTACQTKKQIDPATKGYHSLARQSDPDEAKFDDMIETVSNGLLELRYNDTFRTIVHNQVALQFDGDDNVLLNILDSACAANEIDLASKMELSLNNVGRSDLIPFVQEAIHGFKYFDDTMYLQIFVPDVAKITSQGIPIIIENHTTEANGIHEAFSQTGTSVSVNAATAGLSLDWVISVNEAVGNNGKPFMRTSGTTGGGSPSGVLSTKGYFIHEIQINDKKEDFFNGSAELCFVQNRYNYGCNIIGSQYMHFVGKFNTGKSGLSNEAVFADVSHPWNNSGLISTIWYERDVRKIFDRVEEVIPSCSNSKVSYRSQESHYGVQTDFNPFTSDPWYSSIRYDNANLTGLELQKVFY